MKHSNKISTVILATFFVVLVIVARSVTVSSIVKANPPEKTNNISTTVSDHKDDLADFASQGVNGDGISLQERYEADVKTAQLNEMRRLNARASNLSSVDKNRLSAAEPDSDGDGMPDTWESSNGLDPNNPSDAWTDPDSDYTINLFEYQLGSNPHNAATPNKVTVSAGGNVAAAIDSATAGQVIRVERGTYNVNYISFSPKTVMIQGGWNSNFTRRELGTIPTIFDGRSLKEVLYFSFSSGANSVILDGLTLINGKENFGALNMLAQGTAVMKWSIMNSTIVNSEATSTFGGATHILHWQASESDVFIINSITANNGSSGITNQTTDTAVGRWNVINSDITHNQSVDAAEGYGIDGFTLDTAVLAIKLKNTILWGNQKTDLNISGFGGSTTIEAEYSDVGTVNAASGAIYTPVAGVINSNPRFVNPANGDFTVQEISPCIDSGTNNGAPPNDRASIVRPVDGDKNGSATSDIGAFEFLPERTYLPLVLK